MDISIYCTSCQEVRVVGGEVDVGDCPAVGLEGMLYGARGRVIPQVEVPHQAAVVGS